MAILSAPLFRGATCACCLFLALFAATAAADFEERQLPNLISCYGVTPTSDGRLLFTTSDNGIIGVFDAVEGRYQEAIDLRGLVVWPTGGVVARGKLYVESFTDIVVIDATTLEVLTLIPQRHFLGSHFGALVATADGSSVFGIVGSTTHLARVDTETDTIDGEVEVGGNFTGIGISPDETRVYLSSKEEPGRFLVIDAETLEILADTRYADDEHGMLEFPTEITVAGDGTVYVSYVDGDFYGRVAILSPEGEFLGSHEASSYSTGVDITPDGEFLILGNGDILGTQFGEQVAHVDLPTGLASVSLGADGGSAYITNINSQFLYAIDGFTPLLFAEGDVEIGGEIVLSLRVPGDPERMFQVLASGGASEGILLPDGRVFPLDDDHILRYSREVVEENPVFHGFVNFLDETGTGQATISVNEELLNLVGESGVLYVALATMWNPPPNKNNVKTISNVLTFVLPEVEEGEGEGEE